MEAFIGQVTLFAGLFAPRGWAVCDGQLLSIAHNSVLFSILGTTYGGDGDTTFALPDLRTRVPLGASIRQAPGLPRTLNGDVGIVNESTGTTPQFGTLGMNYIICINGVVPPRN